MRLDELLFESPENDITANKNANTAYHRVVDAISSLDESDFEAEIGDDGVYFGYKADTVGFDLIGLPNLCLLLGLKLHSGYDVRGSLFNFKEPILDRYNQGLMIHGLKSLDRHAPKKLMQTLSFRATFLHELTHAMDFKRSNGGIFNNKYNKGIPSPEYFNDPAEFNAFYTEIADSLLSLRHETRNMDQEEKKEYWDLYGMTGNASTDIEKIMNQNGLKKQFLVALRPERRKALLSRLVKLHQTVFG